MKKNISINIFGTIYAIDEDAYSLLESYLQNMKNYFKAQDGGDEIADDIEHRVAELLWQYREQGMEAVNIETVKEIIDKIGNAAEISDDTAAPEQQDETRSADEEPDKERGRFRMFCDKVSRHLHEHRLYRNTQDKILGGVCSGLAEYFGKIDVAIWRLGTVALAFLNAWYVPAFPPLFIPVLYVLLWVIVPEATTPEDKLLMKGRKVTPKNLKEQIVRDSDRQAALVQNVVRKGPGCLRLIGSVFFCLLAIPLSGLLLFLVFSFVALLSPNTFWGSVSGSTLPDGMMWLYDMPSVCGPLLWIGLLAGIVVSGLSLVAIYRFIRTNQPSLPGSVIFTSVVIWVVSLAIAIVSLIFCTLRMKDYDDEQERIKATRNGISLESVWQWQCLDELGWTLSCKENVNDYIVSGRSGYGGLPGYSLCIRRHDSTQPMSVRFVRTEHREAGEYVLETLTDVKGQGTVISVTKSGEAQPLAVIDPSVEGTRLQTLTWEEAVRLPIFSEPDSAGWRDFADGNEHWTYHVSRPFHHEEGDLTVSIAVEKSYLNNCDVRQVRLRRLETEAEEPADKRK